MKKSHASSRESYRTLSYVWGHPSLTRGIWLEDVEVEVTLNLESALKHLRLVYRSIVIWIDALCIKVSSARWLFTI